MVVSWPAVHRLPSGPHAAQLLVMQISLFPWTAAVTLKGSRLQREGGANLRQEQTTIWVVWRQHGFFGRVHTHHSDHGDELTMHAHWLLKPILETHEKPWLLMSSKERLVKSKLSPIHQQTTRLVHI